MTHQEIKILEKAVDGSMSIIWKIWRGGNIIGSDGEIDFGIWGRDDFERVSNYELWTLTSPPSLALPFIKSMVLAIG